MYTYIYLLCISMLNLFLLRVSVICGNKRNTINAATTANTEIRVILRRRLCQYLENSRETLYIGVEPKASHTGQQSLLPPGKHILLAYVKDANGTKRVHTEISSILIGIQHCFVGCERYLHLFLCNS